MQIRGPPLIRVKDVKTPLPQLPSPAIRLATALIVALSIFLSTAPAVAAPPPLLRPVEGRLLGEFDAPTATWAPGHRGVDLFAIAGTPVLAAADGVVAFAGTVVDREVLSIDHDGSGERWRTTYEPVHANVRAGQRVSRGQLVGWVMTSDECLLNCLHWGLRRGRDAYLDPLSWLAATGVRLVPETTRPAAPPAPAPAGLLPLLMGAAGAAPGEMSRPVSGPVTSPYGMRRHPVLGVWKLHDGIDYGAACGTPVAAAAAGRVVAVEHHLAYGMRVIVDHGSKDGRRLRTGYTHLSGFSVAPGQSVGTGQVLGRVGSTGYSTGCHLHFMVTLDGRSTDPAGWVK